MYNIKYQNPYVERLIKQRCNKPIETDILEDMRNLHLLNRRREVDLLVQNTNYKCNLSNRTKYYILTFSDTN